MNFEWNSQTIQWYQAANAHSGFYSKLAELIAPKLEGYTSFCDIGCGLGLIDLELSRLVSQITCIDISREAIAALQKSLAERKIGNIEARLSDYRASDESWDVIHVSFFGSRELAELLPRCRKLIAVVSRAVTDTELYPGKYRSFHRHSAEEVEMELRSAGIPFSVINTTLDFGQPLVSLEEAQEFVRTHSPEITHLDLADFLSRNLVKTGQSDYPFLLPHRKPIGIFEIFPN
jgi:SAM-dependent methyltransferase